MRRQHSESLYTLHRWKASEALSAFVEQYWWVSWDHTHASDLAHQQKNIPDPSVAITCEPAGVKRYGPVSECFTYRMQGVGSIFGIKFTAGGYHALTAHNMAESVNTVSDLNNCDALLLSDLLPGSVDNEQDARVVITAIEARLTSHEQPSQQVLKQCNIVNAAVRLIKQHTGLYNVARLAELLSTSERSLQRLFHRFTGMSPKQVIRQIRIQEVLSNWDKGESGWDGIVTRLGYTDQAHFIKDFKRMTGETPGKYLLSL